MNGRLTLAALVISGWGMATPAWAAREVQAYANDHFYPFTGFCDAGDRDFSGMLGAWYSWMGYFGHNTTGFKVDGFNETLFCDPDTGKAGCQDAQNADSADFTFIGTHGSDKDNHWQGLMQLALDPGQDCRIAAPESSGNGDMRMGDADVEILHLSSCHSMDDDNIPYVRFLFEDPVDTPVSGKRLHLLTGLHGMGGAGSTYDWDYMLLAQAGQYASVAVAWMDTMEHMEMENQKCPVAYAVGVDFTHCSNRLSDETYQNVLSDPSGIGTYCYYYFEGCHPESEDVFTPN